MKKVNIKIILLFVALFAVAWYFFSNKINPQNQQNEITSEFQTQENNEGLIKIKVVPKSSLNQEESQWKFEVILDSHALEIMNDMSKDSVLVDDKGNVYRSITWEGDAPGGHHREGILVFDSIAPKPNSITLQIKNVGDVENRDFSWKID
ncbi:MAG: hypothetical protein US63_C0019G0008 [Candidatus Moranbacteria bacterium GW2011_GWC2_37_8]|nr:MAG: hypothetical protein US63_C0019G0008 [Candidatus Moranbacteria bacterium GW2011_GWC2_37_8]KKQ62205.1 MAG: hypothetical protein US82_C0017G0012 [Parcubacteria group bacterium GW2011_GWC1_38_22]KKQ79447.1 MAG: hypothetical protein UT03_C0054G0010 [Candidatus Moranbacteria bacterium GW2011_GWD2_38_7]